MPATGVNEKKGELWLQFCRPILRYLLWMLLAPYLVGLVDRCQAQRYTPESPEVRAMVDRAVGFIERKGLDDARFGAEALTGLALLKAGRDPSHPMVQQAAERVVRHIPTSSQELYRSEMVYSLSAATIFLCELDPSRYRREIQHLVAGLQQLQKGHGGWGYPVGHKFEASGDTSMSQFAVLALWEASRAGIPVPGAMVTRVGLWFVRTQDPSGGWGYQGIVAPGWDLVPQNDVRHSLSAAALASLYAIADLAGLRGRDRQIRDSDLPEIVRPARQEGRETDTQVRMDGKILQMAIARAKAWQRANYMIDPPRFRYYYLYALERMWTFREYLEGPTSDAPPWYDQGVEFLRRTQSPEGSWEHECGQVPDTAFGILFLVRSMKKSVEKVRNFGEGTLIGGRGLPKNTGDVAVVGGQVVAKPELANLEKLLATADEEGLEEADEWFEALLALPPDEATHLATKYSQKFQSLATSASKEARLMAVRALGRSGDLAMVPSLIRALEDPDPDVVHEARRALKRIGRLDKDFGPPEGFSRQQQLEAIEAWKRWYRTVRPEAEIED